jgi:putative membrane protein
MVSGLHHLTPAEREKIAGAVAAAQAGSDSRFALVVVPASDRYHLYPVVWGAGVALIALAALALGLPQLELRPAAMIVVGIFLAASLVLEWRPLRMLSVPRRAKHAHAHALAHREFAVRVLAHPEKKGGVLFFVSLAERYAEIIADHALHEAAGQAAWDGIVAEFTSAAARGRIADGFLAGCEACGALLAEHHPRA